PLTTSACTGPFETLLPPFPGPPQLLMNCPAALNTTTGGAALARCSSGIVAGRCKIQISSRESTATEDTSPKTQLLRIAGHEVSGRKSGTCPVREFCAPKPANAVTVTRTRAEM